MPSLGTFGDSFGVQEVFMKYFKKEDALLFCKSPNSFTKHTKREILQYAIGANLYMPGTKNDVFQKLIGNRFREIGSITLCLEDAICEEELEMAEENVRKILKELSYKMQEMPSLGKEMPLIFIRVRNVKQFEQFAKTLSKEMLIPLCGFCFPKYHSQNGRAYFEILHKLKERYQETLYGMPILEDRALMMLQSRTKELSNILEILLEYKQDVLNIRVGGTDFSSIFGLRRSVECTIYDIHTVSDCLVAILNTFLPYGFVISGPVWEYFSNNASSKEIAGLRKELKLDIENGFHGKTIIHPSQINIVNESYVVSYEDYMDALDILRKTGGVSKGNGRMNEAGPHQAWAQKILAKASVFGVWEENVVRV